MSILKYNKGEVTVLDHATIPVAGRVIETIERFRKKFGTGEGVSHTLTLGWSDKEGCWTLEGLFSSSSEKEGGAS